MLIERNEPSMTSKPNYDTPRSELLHSFADKLDAQIDDPTNPDDPKWLARHAAKVRRRALKKEKSLEHKVSQRPK